MGRLFGIKMVSVVLLTLAPMNVGCGSEAGSEANPGGGGTAGTAGAAGASGGAGEAGSAGAAGIAGAGGSAGSAGEAGSAGAGGSIPQTRMTISGDATWAVSFDDDAKAAGALDCEYKRHYEGVQDQSRPWVCPQCEVIFRTSVELIAGLDDCFPQVSDIDPAPEEWVGYANGKWYRSMGISDQQGDVTIESDTATWTNAVLDLPADILGAGTFGFDITGSFTLGEEDGDPNHGWVAQDTYSCGWDKTDPAPYVGDYALATGTTLPDGLFRDKCDEVFRLHDYKGKYVVVFSSALDCPACNMMAADEAQFMTEMAAQGIEVVTITLMTPSLDDSFGDTSKAQLEYWTDKFEIPTPIVADRGWGVAVFVPAYPQDFGVPAWIVADPELKVIQHGVGVDWAAVKDAIEFDAQ